MEFVTYDIESRDFRRAGAASRALKERLKLIGADAEIIRRTMIAAYEAEMNVVIHSLGGRLEASLSASRVDVDVVDRGPGIPDIEKAMTEGFSTAGADARALGFGAGLGLPNIKRNSDRLRLTSRVGEGTRVSFRIDLKPGATDGSRPISLHAIAGLCRDCRACLTACPTMAMRVRDGRPSVLEHLCIDCAECISACPSGALGIRKEVDSLEDLTGRDKMLLVVPPALLVGCGQEHPPALVWKALEKSGFEQVTTSEPQELGLRAATMADAMAGDVADADRRPKPVISTCCPAVVNLVELRFPSLVTHLAPFDSPWEAIGAMYAGRPAAFVVSCPSQRTALAAAVAGELGDGSKNGAVQHEYLHPEVVRQAVMERLTKDVGTDNGQGVPRDDPAVAAIDHTETAADSTTPLTVTGAAHVAAVLEQIEDGLLGDIDIVEPYMCDGGCFGSPLLSQDHHIAMRRWAQSRGTAKGGQISPDSAGPPLARPRHQPFTARPGVRLDADMSRAIEKLGRLQATIESLPGRDCSACGAPNCAALAEDVVMQRAETDLCPYLDLADKEVATDETA